ncbi:unnamed protein product, partial [Gulo gulo]
MAIALRTRLPPTLALPGDDRRRREEAALCLPSRCHTPCCTHRLPRPDTGYAPSRGEARRGSVRGPAGSPTPKSPTPTRAGRGKEAWGARDAEARDAREGGEPRAGRGAQRQTGG